MIRGSVGDHTLSIRFEKDLKGDDGEVLVGECAYKSTHGHVAIAIDSENQGLGLFNTVVHEISHGAEHVYGLDVGHQTIYTLTAGICQALISSGLVDPQQFEARLRMLMANAAEKPAP
jgi:hypothetical protein